MIRTRTLPFTANKTTLRLLGRCNRDSAFVWNFVSEMSRGWWLATRGYLGVGELEKRTRCLADFVAIPSQSVQAVCQAYDEARTGARKARAKGCNSRYPYKQKAFYPTTWKQSAFSVAADGTIGLGFGIKKRKRQPWRYLKVSAAALEGIDPALVGEVRLDWTGKQYEISLIYDDGIEVPLLEAGQVAGCDMGEIHTCALVAEDGASMQVSGRMLRSTKRNRNRGFGKLQRLRSRCKRGSRRWKKLSRAMGKLGGKTGRQLDNALHVVTAKTAKWCKDHDVKTLAAGDVEGVQRGTRKGKKRNRRQAQKLSQWQFGAFRRLLAYKLAAHGIALVAQDESFTTQECPSCHRWQKPAGRIYRCACGYARPRDVHGAANILTKHLYGEFRPVGLSGPTTYLRAVTSRAFRKKAPGAPAVDAGNPACWPVAKVSQRVACSCQGSAAARKGRGQADSAYLSVST